LTGQSTAPDVDEVDLQAEPVVTATGPGGGAVPRAPHYRRRRLIEDGVIVATAIVVAILVRAFVAQAYWIPSASMVPQLRVNDRVVVSRLAYELHGVHRGDIIVFKSPPGVEPPTNLPSNPLQRGFHDVGVALGFAQDQTVLIKRVIGLPGDRLWATGGHIYVNGELLIEPYLPKGTYTSTFGPVTVGKGDLWVMGDNRTDSTDSRVFGAIPKNTVVGRAIWKVWPPWDGSFL
jgi:signal peptidase I